MTKHRVKRHEVLGTLLDEHLELMSGKQVRKLDTEQRKYIRIDFLCSSHGDAAPGAGPIAVRPFSHFRAKNVIEYKSAFESLNEKMFRNYAARALLIETEEKTKNEQGHVTLTIVTSRRPRNLLRCAHYGFERLEAWKYVSRWLWELEITILVLKEMKGQRRGEALALLQVLEEDCWQDVLAQQLENTEQLERVMKRLDEEKIMILAEKYKDQGRLEGKLEGKLEGRREGKLEGRREALLEVLSWTAPQLAARYKSEIQAVGSEEELSRLKERIRGELENGAASSDPAS